MLTLFTKYISSINIRHKLLQNKINFLLNHGHSHLSYIILSLQISSSFLCSRKMRKNILTEIPLYIYQKVVGEKNRRYFLATQ
jgi:hypothetical protein